MACRSWLRGWGALALLLATSAAGASDAAKRFNLPAGDAEKTLQAFHAQSGVQVLFSSNATRGVKTSAVRGDFPPRRALELMLEGTRLHVRSGKSGAFVVSANAAGNGSDQPPAKPLKKNETPTPPKPPPMKKNRLIARLASAAASILAPLAAAQTTPATTSASAGPSGRGDVVELSPFTVTSDADTGWVASASLAGSRMNTPLRDTGASISVLTSEFIQDLGAIDIGEAVDYAVNINMDNMLANDTSENFLQESFDVGRMSVRGIRATSTRNYYRWRLQSDAYNIDRIEENRGPNSILFGIGSAGGVINSMTKQANLGRDFRKASLMFGSYGTYRGTVDVNERLLDDKLAVRLNAVHSHAGEFRHHAYNETSRVHLASTFKPRQRTRLRLDFEMGDIDQVTIRAFTGQDGISNWLRAGSPIYDTVQTADLTNRGVSRYATNATRYTYVTNVGYAFDARGLNRSSGTGEVIVDESILDQSVNPSGPGQRRWADLTNLSVFWEEQLFERTFLELSHNRQWGDSVATITGQGTSENVNLFVDPLNFLPNGQPNPYAGEFFFEGGRLNQSHVNERTHASRLMLSHEQDAGKWGNYRLAAMGEYERRNEGRNLFVEVWEGAPFNSSPENAANHVFRRHYATRGDWSSYYLSGSGDGGLLTGVPHPTDPSRTLNSTWVPFNQGSQRDPVERQRTFLLGGQARYLGNRLVVAGGFRRDLLSIKNADSVRDPVTRMWTLDNPDVAWSYQTFSAETKTLGVVGHLTKNISLFYNASNSLNLPNTGHRILPDSGPPGLSDSKGQDIGISLSFFDGKLVARANAFEVELVNATGGGFGGTFSNPTVLHNDVMNAVLAAGLISQAEADSRDIESNNAIKNQRLEGYELNVTGRLTRDWQVTVNYSYTDGRDTDIGPEVKAWAVEAIPYYLQWPDVMTTVVDAGQTLNVRQRVELWERNAATEFRREGLVLLGNRKHKFNFFTRYSFNRGPLNGLFVGGGYRYTGKMPTNFSTAGALSYSKSRGEADLLMGYRLPKMRFLPNGARLQLNVRNLFDATEPHITRWNVNNPSVPSRAALVAPRSWRLTTSFEF